MEEISYASLKLKPTAETKSFTFNDKQIEVLQYLDIDSKYDLVMITLQRSLEGEVFNLLKLDMYFHLHLVYMYSNLKFTEKQQEEPAKIYDCLKTNGLLDSILELIPEDDYRELKDTIESQANLMMKYTNSVGGVIKGIMSGLSEQMQSAINLVENFDKEKFQEVINFAKAANADRPIPALGQK